MFDVIWNLVATWLLFAAMSPLAFFTCCCGCTSCGSTMATSYQIVITDLTAIGILGGCTTPQCALSEGTYIADEETTEGNQPCFLQDTITSTAPPPACRFDRVVIGFGDSFGVATCQVQLRNAGDVMSWVLSAIPDNDCSFGAVEQTINVNGYPTFTNTSAGTCKCSSPVLVTAL